MQCKSTIHRYLSYLTRSAYCYTHSRMQFFGGVLTTCRMHFLSILWYSILGIFISTLCFAYPIPKDLKEFLLENDQKALVDRFEAISEASPEEFVKALLESNPQLSGAGFNGIAIADSQGRISKISHAIFGNPSLRKHWAAFLEKHDVPQLKLPVHEIIRFQDIEARQSTQKELLGTLLWAMYFPHAATMLPDLITSDGFAYRRTYVPGIPLNEVLKNPQGYNTRKIWEQIVRYQNLAEIMLWETGLMVDLLNAANFLISGPKENPIVELVDHEFVVPTEATRKFYKKQGIVVPKPRFFSNYKLISWPVMPDHILLSKNWALSFEQALEYLSVRYGYDFQIQAIEKLAETPEWRIDLFSERQDYSLIRKARSLLSRGCEKLLSF